MSRYFSSISRLAFALLVVMMFGCAKDSSTPIAPGTNVTEPKGTVTGLIFNRITNRPVPNAKISLGYDGGVQSVTSDSAGQFSFANVPAGSYQTVGGAPVFGGSYTATISLVDYNATQPDPTKLYRNYYYSTFTITFTSLGTGDTSSADGMVGTINLGISYLNTTVKGSVVDKNMQPVSGAVITLYDRTVVPAIARAQTSSASDGTYQFNNIDNGLTVGITAVSSDGSLQGNLPGVLTLPGNLPVDSLRAGVTAERIVMLPVDDTNPFVIGITPENNSDVSPSNLQVVYTFSEPIKQTAYTRTDLPVGNNTMVDDIALNFNGMKKTTGAVSFAVAWNATFTQLTVTPQGLVGSAKYSLDMTGVFGSGKITDVSGNVLVNNTSITGDFEVLNFTTSGGSTVPATPTVSRRYVPGVFGPVDYNGGVVGLEWNYDANARSYNIYKSVDGSPFQLLQGDYYQIQFSENTGSLVVPIGSNNPLSAGSVSYEVTAVSRDLVESAPSAPITVTDAIAPALIVATVAPAGGTNAWTYTMRFTEPLNIANAENLNSYLFTNTGGVTFTKVAANYIGFSGGTYVVELFVTTSAALPAGYTLVVSGATDLAGNGVDQTANSQTF